jgi:hypothetical protein
MGSPMAYDRRALSDWSLTLIMFHVSAGQNEDKLCSFMIELAGGQEMKG